MYGKPYCLIKSTMMSDCQRWVDFLISVSLMQVCSFVQIPRAAMPLRHSLCQKIRRESRWADILCYLGNSEVVKGLIMVPVRQRVRSSSSIELTIKLARVIDFFQRPWIT